MRSESEVRALPGDLQWKLDNLRPLSCGVASLTAEEWDYVRAALASQGEQHGALPIGDDGQPMVLVSQEFKSQADHDAETASAVANLLRNNSLGLSGSQPEMVAALLDLAARQPVGQEVPSVAATCDQYVIGDFGEPRKCANKPAAGDTLCKRHRARAEKTGYCAGNNTALASQPQAPAAAVPEDTARLDWLDAQNIPMRMGWDVGKAPAGNVSIRSAVFLGREIVSIRAAIDAARLAAAPAPGAAS